MDRDELARAACRGEAGARDTLGPWLLAELRRYIATSFSDRRQVHDLCQDAMAAVWTKAPQKRLQSADALLKLTLGIAGITVKRARTKITRERQQQARLTLIPSPDPSRSPTTKLAQREVLERLVSQLSTPLRDTVRSRLADRDVHEFAAEQGITAKTAWWRYHEAVKQLQELLAKEGLSPSQCGL